MKQELEDKLVEKYHEFFDYLKENEGPIIPIQFGIECGDGWYWLLDNLMEDIQSYTNSNCERERIKNKFKRNLYWGLIKFSNRIPYKYSKHLAKLARYIDKHSQSEKYNKFSPIQIIQIKEKYGGLRFYYNGGDDYIHGMVWLAESMSLKICETCGTTKNVFQTKGWIRTTCQKCEDKRLKKR